MGRGGSRRRLPAVGATRPLVWADPLRVDLHPAGELRITPTFDRAMFVVGMHGDPDRAVALSLSHDELRGWLGALEAMWLTPSADQFSGQTGWRTVALRHLRFSAPEDLSVYWPGEPQSRAGASIRRDAVETFLGSAREQGLLGPRTAATVSR